MVEQLLNHLQRHKLCKTTDKILLAVSGGIDSMVMLHLFHDAKISFGVAHCNFQLRGEDSTADEALVNMACVDLGVQFHARRFATESHAHDRGLSIQMAARELRYSYFEEVRQKFGYDLIATAHHLDDSLETIILNLTRGTGIEGITGIPLKKGFVIRPMLFASRNEIENYATFRRISWREDKSNLTDDYARNVIRHRVLPVLTEINPAVIETFRASLDRLKGAANFSSAFISSFIEKHTRSEGEKLYIDEQRLSEIVFPEVLLWTITKRFGFNYDQCSSATQKHQVGKQFFSQTHTMLMDRDRIAIYPTVTSPETDQVMISENEERAVLGEFEMSLERSGIENFSPATNVEFIDASLLKYPLIWRRWTTGDSFKPLGMNGQKKVSDLLIDMKISRDEKDTITVLESDGKIVWVVSKRLSAEFAVSGNTSQILRLSVRQRGAK